MSINPYKGISFDGIHSYNDLGMYLSEYPEIDMPEVQDKWVEVPGRDGRLNLTRALDGLTHYNDRDCEFKFLVVGEKADAMAVYSRLGNLLHGQLINKIVFDEDDGYYYTGQLEVSTPDYKNYRSTIKVTGELQPYKHEMYAVGEDWLWDDLDFENGTIRDANDWTFSVDGATSWKKFTVDVGEMPVCPTLAVSGADGLKIRCQRFSDGTYVQSSLTDGTDKIVIGFILKGSCSFWLYGTGTVAMTFSGGRL